MSHHLSSRRMPIWVCVPVLSASLLLTGCATGVSVTAQPTESGTSIGAETSDCAGVRVLVDFGELGEPQIATCVEGESEITAVEAFALAHVELTEGQAFPGSICRVSGQPAADLSLNYDGASYHEDCTQMGPAWAYWGFFVDQGAGWGYAQEGVATQMVAPGDSLAFAWQFGDTTEPRLPTA